MKSSLDVVPLFPSIIVFFHIQHASLQRRVHFIAGRLCYTLVCKAKRRFSSEGFSFVFYPIALGFLQILSKILYLSRSVCCSHLICLATLWRLVNPCTCMLQAPNLSSLIIILFVNGISIFLQ